LSSIGFVLDDHEYRVRNGKDLLIKVLQKLAERDPSFLERFAARPKRGQKRRYVAHSPGALYPGTPRMADDPNHFFEVYPGWFVDVHRSYKSIEAMVRVATEVAGIRYGTDLRINFGK
jgi:hypothetical protein